MKKIVLPVLCLVAATAFGQGFSPGSTQSTERELFMEAENRFLNHDYELALNRYDAFIKEYPLSQYVPDAQFRRAVTLYRLGDYQASLDLFQRIDARYRSTRYLALVPFWKGVVEYYLGKYVDSVQDLDQFLSEKKGAGSKGRGAVSDTSTAVDRQALLYRGLSQLSLNRKADAQSTLEELMSRTSSPADESYGLALLCSLYYRSHEYHKIIALYKRTPVEQIDPSWRDRVSLYAAEAYYSLGETDAARPIYQRLESAPGNIAAVAFTRLFQMSTGNEAEQTKVLQSAERVLAGNTSVLSQFWLTVGIESYRAKKFDLSEYYFRRLWELRDNQHLSGAVPLYLADLFVKQNKDTQAIQILKDYLKEAWTAEEPLGQPHSGAGELPAGSADLAAAGPLPVPKPAATSHGQTKNTGSAPIIPTYRDRILARLGGLYLANDDWASAEVYLSECRTVYPDSEVFSQATYQYAYALYRLGKPAQSLAAVTSLMQEGKASSFAADLLRLKAADQEKLANTSDAIDTLQEYLKVRPGDTDARIDLVRMLFQTRQYEQVVQNASELLKRSDLLMRDRPASYVELRYMLGLSYVAAKQYTKAIDELVAFRNLSKVDVEIKGLSILQEIHPYVLFYLGWSYYRDGQYKNAVASYEDLLQINSAHDLVLQAAYLAGWAAYSNGDYPTAERFFRIGAGHDSTTTIPIESKFLLGQTLYQEKKYNEAAQVFKGIYTSNPKSPLADDAWFEYADSLAHSGATDQAAAAYRQLSEKYPDSPLSQDALFRRADLFYNEGRYEAAREAFFLYRTTYPTGRQTDGALYWGAMCAQKLNEPAGALLLWDRLIADYPNSTFRPDAMFRSATIYEKGGEYRSALNLFSELLARYPDEGKAVGAQKKVDELVLLMSGLSQHEASLLVTINTNGKAATSTGRQAILKLGRLVVYQEPTGSSNRQLVIPLLSQVVNHRSEDPASAAQAQYLLAEMAAQQDDYLKAADGFLSAAAMNPTNQDGTAQSLYRAAEMLKLGSRPTQMKQLVDRIVQSFPHSEWATEAKSLLE